MLLISCEIRELNANSTPLQSRVKEQYHYGWSSCDVISNYMYFNMQMEFLTVVILFSYLRDFKI